MPLPATLSGRADYLAGRISTEGRSPDEIRNDVVVTGLRLGFDWREIVLAVDELERKTGLALHLTALR